MEPGLIVFFSIPLPQKNPFKHLTKPQLFEMLMSSRRWQPVLSGTGGRPIKIGAETRRTGSFMPVLPTANGREAILAPPPQASEQTYPEKLHVKAFAEHVNENPVRRANM